MTRGKPEHPEKNLSHCHLSTTNLRGTGLGSDPTFGDAGLGHETGHYSFRLTRIMFN